MSDRLLCVFGISPHTAAIGHFPPTNQSFALPSNCEPKRNHSIFSETKLRTLNWHINIHTSDRSQASHNSFTEICVSSL